MSTASTSAQTVHQRTRKGQMAAAMGAPVLDEAHSRLLLLFNGFTPTEWLVDLAAEFSPHPAAVARELEHHGLIERVH